MIPFAVVFVLFFGGHEKTTLDFKNFWYSCYSIFRLAMQDFDDGLVPALRLRLHILLPSSGMI
jgi:hypothetical protein